MNYNPYLFPFYFSGYPYFENFSPVDKPPTLYSILNAKLNFEADEQTKISDLATAGRSFVFDFTYNLSSEISKSDFETLFIDHFLERRIGFETFNSFKIHLRAKLREILPYYNKLFDSMADLSIIYNDTYSETLTDTITEEAQELMDRDLTSRDVTAGTKTDTGTITHTGTDGIVSNSKTKFSDTPQGVLTNVDQDRYLTDYTNQSNDSTETKNLTDTFNKSYGDNTTVTGTDTDDYQKDNTRSVTHEYTKEYEKPFSNQLENYQKYLETKQSILTLLLNDLEDLFLLIY